ncbi:MAG: hypothetical protein HFE04_00820 [Bacilli bacterium]|nr:hypothetical protein [Bacilli bacterium]
MITLFNELEQLKQDIIEYLKLKAVDFNTAKSELVDSSKFSTVEDYSKMAVIFKEIEQCSFMYRNAENFLTRLNSITDGIIIGNDERKDAACIAAYLTLRATDEHRIVKEEIDNRLANQKSKGI